jgi:Zn-dependent protease with chaperone function
LPSRRRRESLDAGASRLFGLSLVIAAGALGAVGLALVDGASAVRLAPTGSVPRFSVLHQAFTYPSANVAAVVVLVLAALGVLVVSQLTWAAVCEVRAQRRFARAIAARRPRTYGGVVVVDDDRPQAFCAGIVRPRIYVSTGTLRRLRPDELEAVLAHEEHHRRRRDPLRIAVARMLGHALFFVPVLRRLSDRYCAMAELAADAAAVRTTRGGGATLASALLRFSASSHPRAAVGIAPERVDHLLGRTPSWRLPGALLVTGTATVLTLSVLAWQVGRMAIVHATFDLPFLSSRPCVMALALVPGLLAAVAVTYLRRPGR